MKTTRTLTTADLASANSLSPDALVARAARPVAALRAMQHVHPGHTDPAGVPFRGGSAFADVLDGHYCAQELAAAYVYLRQRGCQAMLVNAIESATIKETPDARS